MIKKLIRRLWRKKQYKTSLTHNAKVITASKSKVDKNLMSSGALKTCAGLHEAGFEAYIVGGAVRDSLLNHKPKDFDITTSATPEQVRKIFRRSRIIGRRFRLVHVMRGKETIEVSTFRSHHKSTGNVSTNNSGRILYDNNFGNIEDDAARRDFTANALYYNPATEEILDFHHGAADIKAKVLRIIGDPATRYQEDPVRMLRAVRHSAKLGLKIHPASQKPMAAMAKLLQDVPPSRLFDETLKLFLSGHAIESIHILRAQHLHHNLLPLLDAVLAQPLGQRFVMLALQNTDDRINQGKSSNPGFLFASLLWHEVLNAWQATKQHAPPIPALYQAMDQTLQIQCQKLAIHNRFISTMKEIWATQPRFEQRTGKRPFGLLTHPRYRAAYDFMLLRCAAGELPNEVGVWWTAFANAQPKDRLAMLLPNTDIKKRKRRKRKKPVITEAPNA